MYKDFLKPVSKELQEFANSCNPFSLGKSIKFTQSFLNSSQKKNKIALFAVTESRSEPKDPIEDVDFDLIRTQLYELQMGNWDIDLYDFGNIISYDEKFETEIIFQKTLNSLLKDEYTVIILGGTPSFGYYQYRSYDDVINKINYISVDSKLRLEKEQEYTTDNNYLTKIISTKPFNLLDYTNLGYQTYYVAQEKLDLVNQLNFEALRLGDLIDSIQEVEIYSRDANASLINLSSIQGADFSSSNNMTPNGFTSREICSISRYLGFSNKLSSLYICDYIEKYKKLDHILLAQIIWYFIEGRNHRPQIKKIGDTQYFDKIFVPNDRGDYIFYRKIDTNQWWLEVEISQKKAKVKEIISCSEKDYKQALGGEIPNKWWKYYKKFF